ncbi:MAG: hypothetical protein AB7S48_09010 [Bacteroidales bacterium]
MNSKNEHLRNLQEIRSIMERSSRFMSLSGLSGIFAGIVALLGALAVYIYQKEFFLNRYQNQGVFLSDNLLSGSVLCNFIVFCFVDAFIVLMLALFFAIYFTTRNARRKGLPFWDATAKRMLLNLFVPLVTGGLFCLILLYHHLVYLIAPSTLLFYGLALINASKFTLNDVRYLGICEIALGLVAMVYIGYGLIFWAFGFGILHIIYGLAMYIKYERVTAKS